MNLSHDRVELSTGSNFPPILTKRTTKVNSQERSLPTLFLVDVETEKFMYVAKHADLRL